MSRRTIRHGAVIKCDVPGCAESFTTYSLASFAREQSASVGFKRIKLRHMPGWEEYGLGESRSKQLDVCKVHVPKPRMSSPEVAK